MKLCIFDLDDTLYDTSHRLDEVTPNFEKMELFPEGLQILEDSGIDRILVTFGKKELQEKKIETLKLKSYFKEIFICEDRNEKQNFFEKILEKYAIKDPKEVVVVGDRIDTEIRFGNMLGCTTVLFKRGKYSSLEPKDEMEIPTYTILSLAELDHILK